MGASVDDKIKRGRKILQNPYAYLDGDGGYAVLDVEVPSDVHEARRALGNQYAFLDESGGYTQWREANEGARATQRIDPLMLLNGRAKDRDFSRKELATIARKLQSELWRHRKSIWPSQDEMNPSDVLDPTSALTSIGYTVCTAETLGQHRGDGELFEIAGLIDNAKLEVHISKRFSPGIRRFTIAHELGHAILHTNSGLHRDRALDGTTASLQRESREAEADLFASYFLLPEKLLREAFHRSFVTEVFELNEQTAFALTSKNLDAVQRRCRTVRDLARLLSSADYYNGHYFASLAQRFGVSMEAMAIRLEELGLAQIKS